MALLVLANSFKEGGSCLAAVTADRELRWVRPVADDTPHGEVPTSRLFIDSPEGRRVAEPLDVIEVPLGAACDDPAQPENYILRREPLQFVQRAVRTTTIPWLRERARKTGPVLGLPSTSSVSVERASQGLDASLDLVLAKDPVFYQRRRMGRRPQPRVVFALDELKYDLPLTDPTVVGRIPDGGRWMPGGEWLVTVSLAVPWNGAMWLIAAGCLSATAD